MSASDLTETALQMSATRFSFVLLRRCPAAAFWGVMKRRAVPSAGVECRRGMSAWNVGVECRRGVSARGPCGVRVESVWGLDAGRASVRKLICINSSFARNP